MKEVDHDFEIALQEYINDVVAAEKERYLPGLRPFSSYEREVREKLGEVFHFFHNAFVGGYRVLIEELRREMETSGSKEDLLALAAIDPTKFKVLNDVPALVKALEDGGSIYELLGFSEKSINIFYQTVLRMLDDKAFTKARDVCYFLVTIAPWVSQLWVCIGRCDAGLQNYEVAFEEFAMAIEVNPTDATAYREIIDLLIEMHEFNRASSLCDAGLQFTVEHKDEPWAQLLQADLEAKSSDIQAAVRDLKSKN